MTEERRGETGRRGFMGPWKPRGCVASRWQQSAGAGQTPGSGSNATCAGDRATTAGGAGSLERWPRRPEHEAAPTRRRSQPARDAHIIRTAFDRGVTFFDAARLTAHLRSSGSWARRGAFRTRWSSRPSSAGTSIRIRGRGAPASTAARTHPARGRGQCSSVFAPTASISLSASRRPTGPDRRRRRAVKDLMTQGKVLHWASRRWTEDAATRACGAAGQCRSERVFDAVARTGGGGHPAVRGARHRLRPVEPLGWGF